LCSFFSSGDRLFPGGWV